MYGPFSIFRTLHNAYICYRCNFYSHFAAVVVGAAANIAVDFSPTRKIAKSFQFQHEFFNTKSMFIILLSFFATSSSSSFSSFQPVINEQISCMLDKFLSFH